MSNPIYFSDGDYTRELEIGTGEWVTPFSNVGDQKSFEYIATYRIAEPHYKRAKSLQKVKLREGYAYMVDESPTSHIGNGIVEYKRTYASIPETRYEYSSISYSRQEAFFDGTDPRIVTITETVPCVILYEYSITPLPVIEAPRIELIDNVFFTFGGWGKFVVGQLYLAQDTEISIYKGGMNCRKSILIKWKALTVRS